MFRTREDAADQLIERLKTHRGAHPLVLGIPRGAVLMAARIAAALQGDFDVVLTRKLSAPGNPEFAIGAVAEDGWVYVSADAAWAAATPDYLNQEKARQLAVIRARRSQYDALRASISPAGRVVIVVDDGLATGATMIAALHALRERSPQKLICAVPVAPPDTLARIRPLCDELVCLLTPANFQAVGQFYQVFEQVSDEAVLACLAAH
jgi:predicted phosphoribosyltransferase